jgi:hypothetical protein
MGCWYCLLLPGSVHSSCKQSQYVLRWRYHICLKFETWLIIGDLSHQSIRLSDTSFLYALEVHLALFAFHFIWLDPCKQNGKQVKFIETSLVACDTVQSCHSLNNNC